MANEQLAPFVGDDFQAYFVISENRSFGSPSASLCQSLRQQYGLQNAIVLYDPSEVLGTVGITSRHIHHVLSEGSALEFRQSFNDRGFIPVLQRLLP